MEKLFELLKTGYKASKILVASEPKEFKKELIMIDQGIMIDQEDWYILNPLIAHCNTYNTAKIRLSKIITKWLSKIESDKEDQLSFRHKMVEDTLLSGSYELLDSQANISHLDYKYRNGDGLAYVKDNEIICFHYGFKKPSNAPIDCKEYKFSINLESWIVIE